MSISTGVNIGDRIKYHRKLRDLTQEELAEKVGVAPTHITNIERGNKGVSLEVLLLICEKLEIGLPDILPEDRLDGSELREKLISEVVGTMNGLDMDQLGIVKMMVCALRG